MSQICVHFAVPDAKRIVASTLQGMEGGIGNFSVELEAIGGDAAAWATFKGYPPQFWGASQSLSTEFLLGLLEDGYEKQSEILYAAFHAGTGLPVQTGNPERPGCNLTTPPTGPSYEAFMAAAGLQKVVQNV